MNRPDWLSPMFYGETVRWQIGDLLKMDEDESGEKSGHRFAFDLALSDHIGGFDDEVYNLPHADFDGRANNRGWNETESRYYLSYSVYFIVWRWGIAVQWRGRQIGRFDWALPVEDEEVSA